MVGKKTRQKTRQAAGENVNLRDVAFQIVAEVMGDWTWKKPLGQEPLASEKRAYLSTLLSDVLEKYAYLPRQERAFLSRLSRGTVERCLELDSVIDAYASVKVKKQKPLVRNILRISVYQLLYMDSVPAAAACDEAVKLMKRHGLGQLKGFVNGILRAIARDVAKTSLVRGRNSEENITQMSIQYSMPQWLVEKFVHSCGTGQAEEILSSYYNRSGLCIRVNTEKIETDDLKKRLLEENIAVSETPLPYALWLEGIDRIGALSAFSEGLFYVQDYSSILAVERAKIQKGERVLDVCASPGGKSIGARLFGGKVLARDISEKKTARLLENIHRLGLSEGIRVEVHNAEKPNERLRASIDVVLCDLPCSGLGVLSRKPEIKYRLTPEDIESLSALQRRMLSASAEAVRPGGRLIYSTCTVTDEENAANAAWFSRTHSDFTLISEEQIFPKAFDGSSQKDGKVLPAQDGFYIAVFHRKAV